MLANVIMCAVVGLAGTRSRVALVEVEVDIGPGLPNVTVIGLPDAAVQEPPSRRRPKPWLAGPIAEEIGEMDVKGNGPVRAYRIPDGGRRSDSEGRARRCWTGWTMTDVSPARGSVWTSRP